MLFLSRIIWYGVVNFSLVSCIQNDVTPSRTTEQASVRSGTAYPKREEMPSLTAAPGPSPDLASSSASAATLAPVEISEKLAPVGVESLAPISGVVGRMPQNFVVTFTRGIQAPSLKVLSFAGTCSAYPSVMGVVAVSSPPSATWSFYVSNAGCRQGETLTAVVNPALVVDIASQFGAQSELSQRYTLQTKGPKPSWTGLPSSFYLSNRSDISIPFSYDTAVSILADNVENHGVLSSGSALGAPICKASVSISSATAGVLHLSNCQGNGAFSVQINENLTQDSLGNPSTSSDLLSFIVDNSPPVVAVFSPAYETDPSSVSLLPKDIAVTMSEPVALSSKSPFSLTGCLDLPAASSPVVNGATVTLPLPTNGCVAGEKLVVAFDPTAVVDAGGNPGVATSISRSYILSKVGPRVILELAPGFIKAPLREGTNIRIPVRYEASKGVVRRPQAFSAAIIAVKASSGVSCEVKFVQGTNLSEDYLTLSGCKGDGGFSFYLSGGTAQDDSGDSNNSDLLSFTVQTTGPTYTGSNAIGGKVRELPGNITFFFSKALNTEPSAAAFSVGSVGSDSLPSGSCTPSIGAVKGAESSEGGLSVQLLATGLCDDHKVTVRVDPTKIYDVAGNSGTGEMQEIAFELSKKGPVINLNSPMTYMESAPLSVSYEYTSANGAVELAHKDQPPTLVFTGYTGEVSGCKGDSNVGKQFSVVCQGISQGIKGWVTAYIPAGIWKDGLGNLSAQSNSILIQVGEIKPEVVSFVFHDRPPNFLAPSEILFTFNKPVSLPTVADFQVPNRCRRITISDQGISYVNNSKTEIRIQFNDGFCSRQGGYILFSLSLNSNSSVKDAFGVSAASGSWTYEYNPPSVTGFSFDPVSLPEVGSKIQIPASARLMLSAAVTADSVSSGIRVSVDGTCNPLPTVGTIGLDSNGTALVIPLSGGSCAPGQTFSLQVSLDPNTPPVDAKSTALVMPTSVQNPIVYTAAKSYVTLFPTKLSFSGNYYKPDQVDQCMSAMKAVNAQCTGALALLSLNDGENSGAMGLPTRYIEYYKAIQAQAELGVVDDSPKNFNMTVWYPQTIDTTLYKPYPTKDLPIVSMNGTVVAAGFQSLLNLGLNDTGTSVGTILTSAGIFPVDGKDITIPIYEGFVSGGAAGPGIKIEDNPLHAGDCGGWTSPSLDGVYSVSSTDTAWGQTVHNWCTDLNAPPYMLCLCWQ